ncbi:glycosyltransferase [Frigidibacter sp. RF13]|uniref:glycosyltransferase n=1 Tax=Frigidibacter sp. RF13 TaxID=2997340 RepID=UPI00226FE19E|nr:glycosyltransferase [Frigidibacter sp. RF13]MCY1126104.1 glycosyltransferase [Frigidibacter sp. RF13]
MILIDAGDRSAAAFEARLALAGLLRAEGYDAVIDEATLPDELGRHQKYEAAALVVATEDLVLSHVLVLTDGTLSDITLATLHDYRLDPSVRVVPVGCFADRQTELGARARVAYATGREPDLVDLGQCSMTALVPGAICPGLIGTAVQGRRAVTRPRLAIFLPGAAMSMPGTAAALQALDYHPKLDLQVILTDGWSGEARTLQPVLRNISDLSELPPIAAASTIDLAVSFGDAPPDERQQVILTQLLGAGRPVIDATASELLASQDAPVLRGPTDLGALGPYLDGTLLPNLAQIETTLRASPWRASRTAERFAELAGLTPPKRRAEVTTRRPRTHFLPTNGVGLGHAQRCALIASEMKGKVAFAAFPSCLPLIHARGFEATALVQKSPDHLEPFANDIVNHRRLQRLLADGDTFVFDGGFIFDSIARAIREKDLRSVWIRRGLWQAGASSSATFDREHLFDRIIIPSEAFTELNRPPGWDQRTRTVGPVVHLPQNDDAQPDMRDRLLERIGLPFERLVVSMLGAGAAADRSAQLQFLCSLFERRSDILHLVIVWPGAVVPPGLYGWTRSRVARTTDALSVARAADLVISAAGYNSFHEVLYHRLPSIFIPQMAEFMDNQTARARAAAERGLARAVEAKDLLRLEQEINELLDLDGVATLRTALGGAELPLPGTNEAAALIDEVAER